MRDLILQVQARVKRWPYRLSESCGHSEQWNGCDLCWGAYFFTWNLVWSARTSQTRILRKKESPVRATGCVLNKLRCDFIRHTYAPFGVEKQLVESDAGKMYLITVRLRLDVCIQRLGIILGWISNTQDIVIESECQYFRLDVYIFGT
jgi:hypothetical protein